MNVKGEEYKFQAIKTAIQRAKKETECKGIVCVCVCVWGRGEALAPPIVLIYSCVK